jgi:hypothetical protein
VFGSTARSVGSSALREQGDDDARFIFLWIAFNAAYAHEFASDTDERSLLKAFFTRLVEAATESELHSALFDRYSGPVRTLIDNPYVFAPFWRAWRDHDASGAWDVTFVKAKQAAMKSLLDKGTARLLCIVFDRLYVLRCQLVHGGATWNSEVNRAQLRDDVRLMESLLPTMLDLMIRNPGLELGAIAFPVARF